MMLSKKTESLLETGLNFQFPWASLLAIIVGFDGRYTSRFFKEVTEMAMIETIVRGPSRSVVLIRCIHQPDQEEGATVGPVYAMYYPKVGHCLRAMNIWCFFIVVLGNDLN